MHLLGDGEVVAHSSGTATRRAATSQLVSNGLGSVLKLMKRRATLPRKSMVRVAVLIAAAGLVACFRDGESPDRRNVELRYSANDGGGGAKPPPCYCDWGSGVVLKNKDGTEGQACFALAAYDQCSCDLTKFFCRVARVANKEIWCPLDSSGTGCNPKTVTVPTECKSKTQPDTNACNPKHGTDDCAATATSQADFDCVLLTWKVDNQDDCLASGPTCGGTCSGYVTDSKGNPHYMQGKCTINVWTQ
jgi:hypothetical protein